MTRTQERLMKAKRRRGKEHIPDTVQVTEKSFIKGAIQKAKNFIKDFGKDIARKGKKLVRDLRKDATQKQRSNFLPGKLITFKYDAKDKKKVFDKQPLCIILGPPKNPKLSKTHVYGLNLHWMKMSDRVKMASFFLELLKKRKGELRYDDVAPFIAKFKGNQVLRMYIIKNIGNRVIEMPQDIFLQTAALPTENWFKP